MREQSVIKYISETLSNILLASNSTTLTYQCTEFFKKRLNLDPQLTIQTPLPGEIFGICNRLFLAEGSVLSNHQAAVGSGSKNPHKTIYRTLLFI